MNSATVVGYVYKADIYCSKHIVAEVMKDYNVDSVNGFESIEAELDSLAAVAGINHQDEHTYDSDDFPKVEFADSAAENESTCCVCHERLVQ